MEQIIPVCEGTFLYVHNGKKGNLSDGMYARHRNVFQNRGNCEAQ